MPLERLLHDERVFAETVDGPVWRLSAGPGRRLVQLPLEPIAGAVAREIGTPVVEVSGGRFLAWEVPAEAEADLTLLGDGPTDAELLDLDTLLDRGPELSVEAGAGALGELAEGIDAAVGLGGVPEGAPRLAREVTLTPDGTVVWSMDRAIPGEVVEGDAPYLLKLRGERLRALQPERPGRQAGLDRDAERAAQIEFRNAFAEFRELQTTVRNLPERFEEPRPDLLWAVFETSSQLGRLSVRGPEAGEWSISDADFELLRTFGTTLGTAGADTGLDAAAASAVNRLTLLTGDNHPWTQRLVSLALVDADAASKVQINDPLFVLMGSVLGSSDALARNRLVYALTQVEPMTPGGGGPARRRGEEARGHRPAACRPPRRPPPRHG